MEDPLRPQDGQPHRWCQVVFFSLPNGDRPTNSGSNNGNNGILGSNMHGPYAHFELLPLMTYVLPTDDVASLVQRIMPRVDPRVTIDEARCAVFDAESTLNWVTPPAAANDAANAPPSAPANDAPPHVSTPPMPTGNDDAYLQSLESKEGDEANAGADVGSPAPPGNDADAGGSESNLWRLIDYIWTQNGGYPHGNNSYRTSYGDFAVIGFERPKRQSASYKHRRTEVGIKIKA